MGHAPAPLSVRRHTIDLRVAGRRPSDALFTATTVSQYKYGLRVDSNGDFVDETGTIVGSRTAPPPLSQLQTNPPNLPLFAQGTVPFLGDYIDIAGPAFVPGGPSGWTFNTAPSNAPVFYATWTDNRDVVAPRDGDWTHYTPPGSTTAGVPSVLDPTKTTSPCAPGQEGMRNQNVYSSRITEGLVVGFPQNIKPLFAAPKSRAFIITLQNLTTQDRSFTLSLAPGAGVTASFQQTASTGFLTVTVPAHSGAARPVFASSSNPAGSLAVNVTESGTCSGTCLSGSIVLNPEGSVSPLAQPDGTTTDIGTIEIYSATAAEALTHYNDSAHFLERQLGYLACGGIAMWYAARLDYRRLRAWTYPLLALALMLLAAALLTHPRNGAKRWIPLGPLTFQPVEIAKLALVTYLAYSLGRKADHVKTFTIGFVPHLVVCGLMMGLLLKQPDLGSSVVLGATTLGVLFMAGTRVSYIMLAVLIAPASVNGVMISTCPASAKLTTCPSAWTPVSVRPAPTISTSRRKTVPSASSRRPWTVAIPSCRAKPWKAPPSYETVITVVASLTELRLAVEPLAGKAPMEIDETLAAFARRRLGEEALRRLLFHVAASEAAKRVALLVFLLVLTLLVRRTRHVLAG